MEQILCINSNPPEMIDPHVEMVQEKLGNDIQIVTYDPRAYPVEPTSYSFDNTSGQFALQTPENRYQNIKAVWYRKPQFLSAEQVAQEIAENTTRNPQEYGKFAHSAYMNMAKTVVGAYSNLPWISDYWAIMKANNRLTNLEEALRVGFTIPQTLITSDREAAFGFYRENLANGVVTKSLQVEKIKKEDGRVLTLYTTALPQDMTLANFAGLDRNPVMFQEQIQKASDVRVTIVGEKVYACEIATIDGELDWRKKQLELTTTFVEHKLPTDIETSCISLVKRLGLKYGAIDLAITPEGKYVYFECNPNGQWGFVELKAGLPISTAFADLFKELIEH